MTFDDRPTAPQVDFAALDRLFAELVALPPARRAERLDAIEDRVLRTAIEELLDADATDGPLDHDPAPTPHRIGAYRVDDEIGRGGMGVVYRAHDDALGRDVAVKVLHRDVAERPDALRRLRREARALAALNHPHIATLYGLEEADGGLLYLVLEYIRGESLSDRLRGRSLDWREAVAISRQIACALEAAHERGLVHRDVKPANIRFDHRDNVKLLDFGLARSTSGEAGSGSAITDARTIFGTASYMSPEQARGEAVDARSDVWGFGCVLFECLAGTRAFDAGHPLDTLSSVLHEDPPWHHLPTDVPGDLVRIVRLCLRRDPDDRWQTIGDIRRQLDDIAQRSTVGRRVVAGSGAQRARRVASLAAAAMLLGMLATIAALRLGGDRHAPTRSSARPEPPLFATLDVPELDGAPVDQVRIAPDASAILIQTGSRLWQRRLDRFDAEPLPPASDHGKILAWDGRSLLTANRQQLARRPMRQVDGRVIASGHWAVQGATLDEAGGLILSPRWSGPLERLAPGATEPTPWTTLDARRAEQSHRWPWALPGGHVLFTIKTSSLRSFDDAILAIRGPDGRHRDIWHGGTAPRWVAGNADDHAAGIPGYLVFARADRLLVAAFDHQAGTLLSDPRPLVDRVAVDETTGEALVDVADDGTLVYLERPPGEPLVRDLVRWPKDGEPELWLPTAPRRAKYNTVQLSPDGGLVAVGVIEANTSIWLYDLAVRNLQPFIEDLGNVYSPVWNPTGDGLAFVWDRPEGSVIAARTFTDKRATEILLADAANVRRLTSWVGSRIHFLRDSAPGDVDLWRLDLETGDARPVAASPEAAEQGSVSPVCELLALHLDGRLPGGGRRTTLMVRRADAADSGFLLSARARAMAWHPSRCELTWIEPPIWSGEAQIEVVSRTLDASGRPTGPERRWPRPELAGFELLGSTAEGELFGYRDVAGSTAPGTATIRVVRAWRPTVREEILATLGTGRRKKSAPP